MALQASLGHAAAGVYLVYPRYPTDLVQWQLYCVMPLPLAPLFELGFGGFDIALEVADGFFKLRVILYKGRTYSTVQKRRRIAGGRGTMFCRPVVRRCPGNNESLVRTGQSPPGLSGGEASSFSNRRV